MMGVVFSALLIAALLVVAAKASLNLFLLTGAISGRNGQLASLVSDESTKQGQILCSITIKNNSFRLSCKVVKERSVCLALGEGKDEIIYPMTLKEGHFSFCEAGSKYLLKLYK